MAYRYQKNPISGEQELIISGFEQGIADSPYTGPQDIRNMNITSTPYGAQVNLKMSALNKPPTVSAVAFTAVASTDIVTVSDTTGWYNAMAITLNTSSAGDTSTGRVYWIGDLSGNTFKLYKNPSLNVATLVDISSDGSGTLSSYTLSQPKYFANDYRGSDTNPSYFYKFLIDSAGRAWWVYNYGGTVTNNLVYLGNTTLTGASGNGIVAYQGYLLVFRSGDIDYLFLTVIGNNPHVDLTTYWAYGWESTDTRTNHFALVGRDNIVYFCNSGRIGSIITVAGDTFDPSDSNSYVFTDGALDLPDGDTPTYIAELGTTLLIGGVQNYVYPWDRVSVSFQSPIILAENNTARIVSSNSNSYIFAGNRGNIYITNGANVDLFKKIPDSIFGYQDPYYAWLDATYWRNQLYFSFSVYDNAGNNLDNSAGVWGINLTSGALYCSNQPSYGSYAGYVYAISNNILAAYPEGNGLYTGWVDGSSNTGVDIGTSEPYSDNEGLVTTEIIPVGDFLHRKTFNNFEFKLGRPMVSGESLSLYQRPNLTASFTLIGTTTTTQLSDKYDANFENVEWVQFQAVLSSTDTDPSYVQLQQIIAR